MGLLTMILVLFLILMNRAGELLALENGLASKMMLTHLIHNDGKTRLRTSIHPEQKTPPMGWMSWAAFMCETDCRTHEDSCINENLYRQMADRLVSDGFLAAGYNRIHIDDCWMGRERNNKNQLIPDIERFSSGIKDLARYMHDRNLELGIYANYGTTTCMGYPGSIGHVEVDAQTFASWDVDYLKLDGCYVLADGMGEGYVRMQRALNGTGRPITFSCSWPYYVLKEGLKVDFTTLRNTCNLWRIYADVFPFWASIAYIIDRVDADQDILSSAQRPGAWNDMDMIVAGIGNLTVDQAMVQMTLWSMWSSPLIMSNDLRTLTPEMRNILLNREVIAIDQDPLGVMGKLVNKSDSINIYIKPVTPVINSLTSFAVAVVNMDVYTIKTAQFSLRSLGLVNVAGYDLRNLWTKRDLGVVYPSSVYKVELPPTSASMLKLTIRSFL